MALPFLSSQGRRLDQVIAVDLGGHAIKAIHLTRKGESYALSNFAVRPVPAGDKGLTPEVLAETLKEIVTELGSKTKHLVLALSVNDSMLRQAELPLIPVSDMRLLVKYKTKQFLMQDLPGHVFDCYILPPRPQGAGGGEPTKPAGGAHPTGRVLVGGARNQTVEDVQAAAKAAGLQAHQIVPGLVGPLNAFELAEPQIFSSEIVALADIGFKNSTISILMNGELALSRVVAIGGDRLSQGLAESMGTSYAEADGIKVGMPSEVQSNLEPLLMPLGRELRASIDAFEHQQDKAVGQVFFSGGSAKSEFIVQCLQTELMVPCKTWNPTGFMTLALPPQKLADLDQVSSQLTVAVGAAISAF